MKPKHKRLLTVLFAIASISIGTAILLNSFRDNLIYFYPPKDIAKMHIAEPEKFAKLLKRQIRVGGMVKQGSYKKTDELGSEFVITDFDDDIEVRYEGLLPPMFREGQGVIAQGNLEVRDKGSGARGQSSEVSDEEKDSDNKIVTTKHQLPSTKYNAPTIEYLFIAKTLITKHDEKYMPPEIKRSLDRGIK